MPEKPSPQVSILVTAYNTESYLPRCLDSILAQTLDDWECVCVDNGSPDNCGAIMEEYAARDSRFVVVHKEYGEVGAGRQAGLDAARGEYIGFVDSDDWIEPETFETALESARQTGADIVQWSGVVHRANAEPRKKKPKKEPREGFFDCSDYREYFQAAVWIKLFRRAFIFENQIRFLPDIKTADDTCFSIPTYALAKKCFYIDRAFYHYDKTREGSVSRTHTLDTSLGFASGVERMLNLVEERMGSNSTLSNGGG